MERYLNAGEIAAQISDMLALICQLCSAYDEMQPLMSLSLAVELQKFHTHTSVIKQRKSKRFYTPPDLSNPRNLAPEQKLAFFQLSGPPPSVFCLPKYLNTEIYPSDFYNCDFKTWWNRDIIFRSSAAKSGVPRGLIPVKLNEQIPYEKRPTLSRRTFLQLVRNKIAAHSDDKVPEILYDLQKFLTVNVVVNGLSTDDGSLPIKTTMAAAMIREIAHETLVAYEVNEYRPKALDEMRCHDL